MPGIHSTSTMQYQRAVARNLHEAEKLEVIHETSEFVLHFAWLASYSAWKSPETNSAQTRLLQ